MRRFIPAYHIDTPSVEHRYSTKHDRDQGTGRSGEQTPHGEQRFRPRSHGVHDIVRMMDYASGTGRVPVIFMVKPVAFAEYEINFFWTMVMLRKGKIGCHHACADDNVSTFVESTGSDDGGAGVSLSQCIVN